MTKNAKLEIIRAACVEATKKRIRDSGKDKIKVLSFPLNYASFFAIDVEQDVIKNIVPYLREHRFDLGIRKISYFGEYVRYTFSQHIVLSIIDDFFKDGE